MKRHAEFSERILSKISAFSDAALIGGAHHERLDGKGYPRGLSAGDIPMEVRIVSTADVFDALTADRPYRAAMPIAKALSILWAGAGQSHDPICIEALERALAKAFRASEPSRCVPPLPAWCWRFLGPPRNRPPNSAENHVKVRICGESAHSGRLTREIRELCRSTIDNRSLSMVRNQTPIYTQ